MEIVTANNDRNELNELTKMIKQIFPDAQITEFIDPMLSVKYVYNHSVSLVILEEKMRPADGIKTMRVLRNKDANLPVVILTKDSEQRKEARELAVDAYFVRPVTIGQLETIKNIV